MEVRRSARRRRSVAAYIESGVVVVLIPASLSQAEERRHVAELMAKLSAGQAAKRRRRGTDVALAGRAEELSDSFLDGRAKPSSVRWTGNQSKRWGSCSPENGTIRLSTRLQGMPGHVIDYVLLHELAHLIEPSHNDRFWSLVDPFPRTQWARGYLAGVEAAPTLGGG